MTLSNTFINSFNAQETAEVYVTLLEISHSDLTEDILVTTDNKDVLTSGVRGIVSNGNEYVYFPFEITLEGQKESGLTDARLTIDNISREILRSVRAVSAKEKIKVNLKIVLASTPDNIEVELSDLSFVDINADAFVVEGNLQRTQTREQIAGQKITPAGFPGLG